MTLRLATQSKGEVCRDVRRSLLDGRPKFLPGRSRRVSFVANPILFNVNQRKSKPMNMSIYSLGQLMSIACLCASLLASCGTLQILSSGSLGSGSLRSGSLRSGSRCGVHTNYVSEHLCVHTIKRYTPRMDRDPSLEYLIGHPCLDRCHFRDLACLMILTIHSSSLLPYSPLFHCRYRSSNSDDVHLSSDPVLLTW